MKSTWTKGLSGKKLEEVKNDFLSSSLTRERLQTLLEDKINTSRKFNTSKDAYDISNWAYLQADGIGYERALNEVISLISNVSVEKD
jgi:hypothetical protein